MKPPMLRPNASVYPIRIHWMLIRAIVMKLRFKVDSRFFLRTMPP